MKTIKLQPGFQLAILRIGVAITILCKVAVEFADLDMLFSQHGIIQNVLSRPMQIRFSLSLPWLVETLHISNEHLFLRGLYIVFACAGFMLLIGYRSRFSAFICLFIHMLIFNGYNLLAFGFDGFLFSLLFYTLVFPVGKVYAADALLERHKRSGTELTGSTGPIDPRELRLYLLVLQVHLCIVYFVAGISKNGAEWTSGTAVWSALNQPQFYTPLTPFFKDLMSLSGVTAAFTWGTLFVECLFPLFIFIRYAQLNRLMLISVLLMHCFIGAVMGLQLFAWIMIVFDLSAFAGVFSSKPSFQQLPAPAIGVRKIKVV
ncbi:HTTM domain-containing protein [Pedobacter sp. JY14-1]|uniref:HTTM domain-containing protein n=1 Tax=Pedobacter sp. JY14-1 TaxID=3034151 RepID=UPI0023E28012|nr:HTTM domain-containing protein [Pedobacter sp. JY14-1]